MSGRDYLHLLGWSPHPVHCRPSWLHATRFRCLASDLSTGTLHDHPRSGELFSMALHGSVSIHTLATAITMELRGFSCSPSTELTASSLFMWFSRVSMTSRLCSLGPHRPCPFSQPRATKDIAGVRGSHFVSMCGVAGFFPTLQTCGLLRSPTDQPPPVSSAKRSG